MTALPNPDFHFSLLWPDGTRSAGQDAPRLSPGAQRDLNLTEIAEAVAGSHCRAADIQGLLLALNTDPDVIRYRQDILEDLLNAPELEASIEAFLPQANALGRYVYFPSREQSPLHEVTWRIGQLELYVECVECLHAITADARGQLRSAGLRRLADEVAAVRAGAVYQNLARELPDLAAQVRGVGSVTLGVNLDDHLRPVEATLLAVNAERFRGAASSLLGRLFGRALPSDEWEGIARLHSAPRATGPLSALGLDNPLLAPLFRDLADVLKQATKPVAAALERYQQVNVGFLSDLRVELAFYLGAARLIRRLQEAGLPMCKPALAPVEERVTAVKDAYNLYLALRLCPPGGGGTASEVVTNDVRLDDEGRILILTGPNRGGKTTYTQAVGQIQILAQAGLYIPGTEARLSPVDGVYTHFPVEEDPRAEAGRLGEEAQRLGTIFAAATRHSLILLNESLATTSPGESLYLAQDIVRALRLLGARGIYATHLHELAAGIDALNDSTPGDSRVGSLVALVADGSGANGSIRQTYRIVPGPPLGKSYAREIASRYGISYEQLRALLRERGASQ